MLDQSAHMHRTAGEREVGTATTLAVKFPTDLYFEFYWIIYTHIQCLPI